MEKKKVQKNIQIKAPLAKVWDALVNPEKIKQYLFGTQTISQWKEGSPILFAGIWEDKAYLDKGKILKFEKEKTFQYTYWSGFSGLPDVPENYSLVTMKLQKEKDHVTLMLTQENFANEDQCAHSEKNWETVLDTIKKMVEKVQPIPEGYHALTSYLIVKNAKAALEFYKKALNAEELFVIEAPKGTIGHAEMKIGNSIFMLAEEFPSMNILGPQSLKGSSVGLVVYVNDVDAATKTAVTAGMKIIKPLADQFYGDRTCKLEDPFGHIWSLATHKENVSVEEMQKRADAMFQS